MSRRKSRSREIPDYSYAFIVICLGLFLLCGSYLLGPGSITGYAVKSGVWIELQDSSYIGGSAIFSNSINSSLEYNVTGIVEVVTQTRDDFGIFDVYVDGAYVESVDTYSADVIYDVRRTYNITSLLEIYVTGNQNELSSGDYIVIDEVIGDGVAVDNVVPEEPVMNEPEISSVKFGNDYSTEDVTAAPKLSFLAPTQANGYSQTGNSTEVNISIVDSSDMNQFVWNWNGTNYTMYNDSLVLMMNFNNNSVLGESATFAVDVSPYSNNMTFSTAPDATSGWKSTGRYGGAFRYDGVADYFRVPALSGAINSFLSICAWVNTSSGSEQYLISLNRNPSNFFNEFILLMNASGKLIFWDYTGADYGFATSGAGSTTFNDGKWHYLCFVKNHTNGAYYIDGRPDGAKQAASDASYGSSDLVLGMNYRDSNSYFNGMMDEVVIFNRSLSADEISQLYMSNLQKFNDTQWYFYANQSKNATTGLNIGAYTYYGSAKDVSGNEDSTGIRTLNIVVDETPPTLSFVLPTSNNGTSQTAIFVPVNISVTESQLSQFIWNWNGTNYTMYNDSLVLMMNFDNRSALGENLTYVVDVSKYGNNGTVIGSVWTASGKYDGAYSFDGSNDYIDLQSTSSLTLTSGYSIGLWINPSIMASSHSSLYQRIVRTTDDNHALFFRTSMGRLEHKAVINGGSEVRTYANWGNFLTNRWAYVVIVTNLTNRYLYVNGVLVNSSTYSSGTSFAGTFDWEISNSQYAFNGSVDEIRIWNRSLSANEINEAYMSNLHKFNTTQWYFYANQSLNSTNGLDNGAYTYYGSAKDVFGNGNSTETRTINIFLDRTPPILSFVSPTSNNGTSQTSTYAEMNISITESQISQFIWNWNNTNYTMYNSSLILMYNFDNVSSLGENSTYAVDVSLYGNNGTVFGAPVSNSTSKYGIAMQFDGTNDYVNAGSNFNVGIGFSASFWVQPYAITPWDVILGKESWNAATGWLVYLSAVSGSVIYTKGGLDAGITAVGAAPVGRLTHITVTNNNGAASIYVNGVLNTTGALVISNSNTNLFVGARHGNDGTGVTDYFKGMIDEVKIWNRSLSANEVSALYMSNLQRTSPVQWYFYTNQTKNATTGLDNGVYTYYGSAKDVAGNEGSTGIRSLTIGSTSDVMPPSLSFVPPTQNNGTSQTAAFVPVNISIMESQLSQFVWNWNNTNYTMYNDSLVLMMNFDSVSSLGENSTKVVDVSKYGNNGTIIGATFNSTGKFNGAYNFDGNDYIDAGNNPSSRIANDITLSAWVKTSASTWPRDIIGHMWHFQDSGILLGLTGSSTIHYVFTDGGLDTLDVTYIIADGNWHHILTTFSSGDARVYVDGILRGNKTSTSVQTIVYNPSYYTYIGRDSGTDGEYWNGNIDEVRIWNKTLTAAEVYQQYASNLNRFNTTQWYFYVNQSKNATMGLDLGTYTYYGSAKDVNGNENSTSVRILNITSTVDTTAPIINSVRNYTNDRITYTFSAISSETGICTLYGNFTGSWIKNESKAVTASTAFNFTSFALLANNINYFWGINCSDASANVGWSANTSFTTKDIYAPIVSNVRNYTNDRQTYTFSAISSETGTCTLYGNFTGSWVKNESKAVTSSSAFNFTSFALLANTTNYFWGVNCSDASANVAWSVNTTFVTKDAYGPNVYGIRNYTNDRLTYTFSGISSETGTCTLYGNFTGGWVKNESKAVTANTAFNFTAISFTNTGFNYLWNVNCTDSSMNHAWGSNISFATADTLAPTLSNIRNFTNDRLTYLFGAQSSESGICTLYGNWSGAWIKNETKSVTANTLFNFTSVMFTNSGFNYVWNINCTDSALNSVSGSNISFATLDTLIPIISNPRNFTNDRLTYLFSVQSSESGSCTLYADFSGSWTKNETKSVSANTAFNFTSLLFNVSRTYMWGVNCSDASANVGWSTNTTFGSLNHVPVTSNVLISPSVVSDVTSLVSGTWTYSDSDSDNENATVYEWYVNGTNGWRDDDLLAYWKLDQNVIDYSGSHNGVTNSVTNVTGKIKQAYSFDGSSSYVKASGFPELGTNGQNYTYSAWFKTAQGETDGDIIHVSSLTSGSGWCLPPLSVDNSKVKAYSWNGAGVQTHSITNILSGVWYHTATTWDVTNGLRVYVNGILENSTTQLTYSASGANNYVWMGFATACAGNEGWFNGTIDEVMIWNRSLSAQEIGDLYNMTLYGQIDHTGANHTITNLTSNYYNTGTTLTFGVTPYDGVDYGTQVNSTTMTVIETTSPVVSLVSPVNNTVDNDGSILLSYNVTDASLVANCSLVVQDVANATNSSIVKSTALQFNANLHGGAYDWYVNCTDTYGNTGKSEMRKIIIVELTAFEGIETSNVSSLDITNITNFIVSEPIYGKINFTQALDLSAGADIDRYVNITYNRIEIDTTALSSLNKSAMLILYNLSFTVPQILKNDALCSAMECTELNYTGGNLTFNVSHFTKYSARETPVAGGSTGTTGGTGTGSSGSGGGGGGCVTDKDCNAGDSCYMKACVKLFDVKIIKFPSPVRAGKFFDFTYYIKGMADIKGDVVVKFWLEKGGKQVSSGYDTVYLGTFEDKTDTTNLFIPSDASSGNYDFYVQVDYGNYTAKAKRLVELQVVDSSSPLGTDIEVNVPLSERPSGVLNWFMTFLMFFLAILLVLAGYHYESREHIFGRAKEMYSGFMTRIPERKEIIEKNPIAEQKPLIQQKLVVEQKSVVQQKPIIEKKQNVIELLTEIESEADEKPVVQPTIENSDNRLIIINHLIDDAYKQLSLGQMYDAEVSYYKVYELYNLLPEELKFKIYQKCIDLRTKLESANSK